MKFHALLCVEKHKNGRNIDGVHSEGSRERSYCFMGTSQIYSFPSRRFTFQSFQLLLDNFMHIASN